MSEACNPDPTQGNPHEAFLRNAEHIRIHATNGGLVELNAACATDCMQAVVCARAEDKFIVLGKEGRRTATF
eukprot:1877310-Prorocentrum_lima.AAC.1